MNVIKFSSCLQIWYTRVQKQFLPLGFLLFFLGNSAIGQVIFSNPGRTYNNTDSRTFDSYGPVDISNCTSITFSLQYSFSLPWEGSGNMEYCNEVNPATGQPYCFSGVPCNCDPNIIALPGSSCYNCWDFLWVRFLVDGVEVGGDLIGDAGTTNAEQSGTISFTQCTNGLSGNASIEVYTQTWAADESVTFSNITITCIDDSPTLPNLGPYCQSGSPVALPSNPGGVSGTWSGPGVSGTTFNPAAAGAGTWVLTFTAAPGECAGSATTSVTVTPFTTPTFTPLAAVCQSAAPIALPTTSQNGISGNWSGTGVSGNTFNPSTAGPGAHTLTFTPAPGSCATTAMLSITVNAAATPTFAPLAALCQTATSVALPTISQNGISGNWSGTGVSGNAFNPSTAGPGVHTLTFTPSPGLCAVPATLTAQVTATTTPMLTPQGPFCSTDPPANLPLVQDGITGSWAGTGVTGGNTFTPATTGNGTFLLTFTPGAGQCANPNSINVMVSGPTATAPAQPLSICYTPIPFSYTDNLAAIVNTINNGTGQQVNWYLDMAGNNSIDPTDPADIQALILGGPNQTIYAAVFNGTCESATIPVNVVLAQSATPALTPQGPFCQGNPAVNLPTSQGGFTGSWSGPGVNNNTFNPNTAGTFPLTFTPAAGQCARPNTLNVTVSTPATPTLNPIGPFCQTAPPVALSTNQGGFNGSWSGPGVNNNSFNPAATGTGTFTITFTPAAGQCAIPNTLNVTVGNITANPAGPLTACDTGNGLATFNLTSLNPQVSQGAGTVNWFLDPGATAPINNPGNFQGGDGQQVYATVSNGTCTSSPVAVQLIVLPLPAANPFSLFECETGNGTATFNLTDANGNVSGGAPVSVSWSFSPAGTPLIPNPSAFVSDDFTVFAIVSNGSCQNSAPVTLTVFDAPNPVLTVATPILCNGDANGSLSLVVTGGQPAYDFDWNINALDGIQNPSALGPGTYSVTVSDGNSCEGTASINLVQPAPLTMNCSVTNPVLTPGGTEGEASVSFSGGTAPFSISWVGPVNGSGTAPTPGTILIPDLEEGTYTVTVQDANGCTNTCTFTVNGPGCDLQLSFNNQQPESCPGAMDGAVDLVITGGTAPFTIDWNDGDTLTTRTGLSAGLYSVTVDDSNGCQASSTLTLGTANPAPQVTIATADTICENECFLFGLQFQGTPPFVLEYAVDTGINQQVLLFESMVTDTALEVCPVDYGRSDGPLEVRFGLLSDANCTDTLNRLEVIQVQPTPAGAFNVVLCPGDSLIYNGTVYNEANLSGMEVLGGAATNGCDSIVAVTIGFFPADTTLVGAQSCDPAQAGRDTLSLQSMNGCDSIVITETLFVPSDTIFLTDTSCDPAQAGLDTLFLQNVAGCDSLVITETFFDANAADTTLLSASTCDPALVGIDTVFLQNTSGCDSLVITETILLPSDETFLMASSCDPSAVGIDTVFLQNTAGCDSLVITETILLPSDETFLMASSCDPALVGIDTVFLQNTSGCDSLVITETVLLPSDETFLMASSCDPSAVGIDTVLFQNASGCDSLVITETVLLPSDETFLMASSCDPSAVGIDTVILQNTAGCDSLVITETVLLPGDETFLMASSCDPSAVGIDTVLLQNAAGCDSLVITETILLPGDETFLTVGSCDPSAVGVDTVMLQNTSGCDSLVITETVLLPSDETFLMAGSCDPSAVGIDTVLLQNAAGCDSLVITETVLLPSDETFLMAGSCDPTQAGVDTVFLQNTAGCDSLVITETFFIPGDETFLTMSSCDPAAVGVDTLFLQNVAGCDSLVITETLLLPTSTTVLERQLCSGEVLMVNGNTYSESNPTGIEVIPGGAVNGCDSIIQVSLTFSEGATGFIEGGRPICPGEALELIVRLQGATSYNVNISDGANVVESYTGISGDVTFSVSPAVSTVYQISLLTAVGSLCPVEIGAGATVTVVQGSDIAVEVLTDYGGFGVSCNGSADAVVGVSAADPGLSYQWNTGQATPTLNNVGAGTYSVTVTSPAGCSAEGSATVTAPAPIIAKADAIDTDCFNELSGSILIESLEGGAGPYEYSLDGQFFNPLGSLPAAIPGLSAGAYTIFFQDANDCLTQAQVQIAAFEGLSLELGEDQTLKLGDSLQLRPQASFEVASFTWAPLTGLLDSASFSPYVRPMETTAYFLTATDSAGCVARDQIIIFINKERGLYAPNVFSPNEDGRNDFFTLFAGPDVAAIRTFQVFDRWGNLLFERAPFQPNIENLGWDGAFNGEPLDPAVFVFYAEVEYVDGFTEVVKGDFVLMR